MTYSYSQLLEVKLLNRELKQKLSDLYGMMISTGLSEEVYVDIDTLKSEFDSYGQMCDSIEETVTEIIKKKDEKHKKRETENSKSPAYQPCSRYEL